MDFADSPGSEHRNPQHSNTPASVFSSPSDRAYSGGGRVQTGEEERLQGVRCAVAGAARIGAVETRATASSLASAWAAFVFSYNHDCTRSTHATIVNIASAGR
jgi:hypothetical protein